MTEKTIGTGKLVAAVVIALLLGALSAQLALAAEPPDVDGLLDESYDFYAHFDGDPDGGSAYAPGDMYMYDPGAAGDVCYWGAAVPRDFNDNAYGDKDYLAAHGWNRGHSFFDLYESDGALFSIAIDGVTEEVWLDYLNAELPLGSGNYRSGQTGDGWDNPVGCQKDGNPCTYTYVNDAATSLYYNLVDTASSGAGAYTEDPWVQSPPVDWNETTSYYWEWQMIYEFTTPKQSDGSCAEVIWAGAHNSPTKNDYPANEERGSIGDHVWLDADSDGLQDGDEVGVPGVAVSLYYSDTATGTWQEYGTTQTDANGYYYFTQLPYGEFYVHFELPDDYDFTSQNAGDDTLDSDAFPLPIPGLQGNTAVITLSESNPYQMYWDAGLIYTGTPTAIRLASFAAGSGMGSWGAGSLGVALVMATGLLALVKHRED